MTEETINANISHCLKSINHIGSSEVVNICNGVHTVVPWGTIEWMLFGFLTAFALMVLAFMVAFVIMVIGDIV